MSRQLLDLAAVEGGREGSEEISLEELFMGYLTAEPPLGRGDPFFAKSRKGGGNC
jgi:hypothetical protein